MAKSLPTGRVTFLFTDIQGSTRLWEDHPEGMASALEIHDRILAECVSDSNGVVVKTMGDGLMAVFDAEADASAAAITGQLALLNQDWPLPEPLRARMGIHTGEAVQRSGDYFGPTLNRAARLMGVGHGGQILVSATTATALESVELVDLGSHRLRDLTAPERIYQVAHRRLPADHPRLKTVDSTPNNLPVEVTSLVGRDEDVAMTAKALSQARLVTLTGFGGMGKTRLATAVAASLVNDYPDGVWFCPLADATHTSVDNIVADILGVVEHSDTDLAESISRVIADKTMLVLLDNCEHVITEVRDLASHLLRQSPNLRLLATSRQVLGTADETIISVAPLATASVSDPGIGLFLDRMGSAGAPEPDEADLAAISSICARLDGIPLALELAAARTRSMTPRDIERRLDRMLGRRSSVVLVAERNATISSTIDWSHDLLTTPEQILYRRLSVFIGGFDLQGAEAVCGFGELDSDAIWEHLDSLVTKSMVMPVSGRGTGGYRMLEPLRDDAFKRLGQNNEESLLQEAHLEYFATFGDTAREVLESPAEPEFVHRYVAEFANMRAAKAHAVAMGDVDRGLRVAVSFLSHAWTQHRFEICDWMIEVAELPGGFDHPLSVSACSGVSGLSAVLGRREQALLWGIKALELSSDSPPPIVQFGLATYDGIDPQRLHEAMDKLRAIEADSVSLEAQIRMHLSGHLRRLDRAAAVDASREHVSWARSTGVDTVLAFATVVLAENLTWAGIGQEAYDAACEAERVALGVGAVWFETHAQLHKARAALFGAETEEPVKELFTRVLTTARDNGSSHQQWTAIETIPHYFALHGKLRESAILVGGRTKSHIEWVHHGAQTQTPYLDRIPPDLIEDGRRIAEDMEIGDLVALSLATLEGIQEDPAVPPR